jgi:hypothetical protein
MNVEIGTEAAQFPEKEYMNGIFVAELSKPVHFHHHVFYLTIKEVLTVALS